MGIPEEHVHNQPVLTCPDEEPRRHWKTIEGQTSEGHTVTETVDEIVDERRSAEEASPIGTGQPIHATLDFDGPTGKSGQIDQLRKEVRDWREIQWRGVSHATRQLLEYWSRKPGEGPINSLFYAQREAIETVIYLTELGNDNHRMVERLKRLGTEWSNGLTRIALRMATGTGKTTVMACLIAWYAVNRRYEHRGSAHGLSQNIDRIVVICPGRTIKDRLACLNPRAKGNLYDEWQLIPKSLRKRLNGFPVDIINWEKLQPRTGMAYADIETKTGGDRLNRTKTITLAGGEELSDTPESLESVWTRLLGPARKNRPERVVALNDEGHHCWERKEGEKPGVWLEALHALRDHKRFRLAQAIDLSATPIFINPAKTHAPEDAEPLNSTNLVPWIVSEYALMEAMETGLVKIPQPPRGDNTGRESALRNLFEANDGQKLTTPKGMDLVRQGAQILYQDYRETFEAWASTKNERIGFPVLIVVANNKPNARAIFEMLGGRKGEQGLLEKSEFPLLSNVPRNGADLGECHMHTILVLSKTNNPEEAEHEEISGGSLGLKEIGKGGASEEELREVLQTVAQPGKSGQSVRCVVSVGMLTEGWDCQRVTHILGYRKFGSQLLCEQTMGRALRRQDYENLEKVKRRDNQEIEDRYPAEYATVFGVPFERQSVSRKQTPPQPPILKTLVHPVLERVDKFRIWIPDFSGYTLSVPGLSLKLNPERIKETYPTGEGREREIHWVETKGPIGKIKVLQREVVHRKGEGTWRLAAELVKLITERIEADEKKEEIQSHRRGIMFVECLKVVKDWLAHELIAVQDSDLGGEQMRDLARSAILDALDIGNQASRKVGIPADSRQVHRSAGDWKEFQTSLKHIEELNSSELNVAACHSKLETDIALKLEMSAQVDAFVRNHGPERIEIPYKFKGGWSKYVPDFFVRCRPSDSRTVHIVIEGKGVPDEQSQSKGWWTDNWWIPCANEAGKEYGQIWMRRELGSEDEVDSAIESAFNKSKK